MSSLDDEEEEEQVPQLVSVDLGIAVGSSDPVKSIPVTILTGFLGAGKSTLLTHILRNNSGLRIAVIENELSEGLGIEGMIVRSGLDGSELNNFFELNNGCICCTIKDSLVTTLEQLAGHSDRFDYIIIETTGVANPGEIVSVFWLDEALNSVLTLDGVVTVVDAMFFDRHADDPATFADFTSQIAYADRILLNKTDLVEEKKLRELTVRIQSMNSSAEIRRSCYSKTDPSWLLHIESFSMARHTDIIGSIDRSFDFATSELCIPCVPSSSLALHSADVLTSCALRIVGEFELGKLTKCLDALLYNAGAKSSCEVYRIKGVVRVAGERCLFVLQGVRHLFDLQPSEIVDAEQSSRFVLIGKNVNQMDVETRLRKCLVKCDD